MSVTIDLEIQASQVPSTQTNFPVYVDLSDMPAEFWSTVTNGGGDIRVYQSDGTTECAREVVSCDTATDTGELHFLANSVDGTTDTLFKIVVDGTSADYAVTDTYGRNAVWADYTLVWHMNDATATTVTDSAGNWDGTKTSSGNPAETTGQIGEAQNITGDYVVTTNSSSLNIRSNKTIQTWINFTNLNRSNYFPGLVSGINSGTRDGSFNLNDGGTANKVVYYHFDGAVKRAETISTVSTGVWYMFHGTHDGTDIRLYQNSVLQDTVASGASFDHGANARMQVGQSNLTPSHISDEVRFRPSPLSANWITTEYNNQSSPSTFYTATAAAGGGIIKPNFKGFARL